LTIDVKLNRFGKKHDGTPERLALSAGEADSPLLEQKQSSAPSFCFTNDPTPLLVLADIKQRDRFADDAGIWPLRKFNDGSRDSARFMQFR